MFSAGDALRQLTAAADMAGGYSSMPKVGWNDPSTFWTPERLRNHARQTAGAPTQAYQRREVGGAEAQFTGKGSGSKVGGGYSDFAGATGDRPRPMRSPMAALQRAQARGNPGWKAGGFK